MQSFACIKYTVLQITASNKCNDAEAATKHFILFGKRSHTAMTGQYA